MRRIGLNWARRRLSQERDGVNNFVTLSYLVVSVILVRNWPIVRIENVYAEAAQFAERERRVVRDHFDFYGARTIIVSNNEIPVQNQQTDQERQQNYCRKS